MSLINCLWDSKFVKMKTILAALGIVVALTSASVFGQVAGSSVAEQQDYTFAVGLYRDQQYQLALKEFQSFEKTYPSSSKLDEVTFLEGECLLQEKMYDSALSDYQRVKQRYPGSTYYVQSELRSGEIYLHLKEFDKSERLLKDALASPGADNIKGEAAYKLGELFAAQDDYDNAIKYFDLSYQGYGNNQFADYAMYGSAWTYGKKGDFAKSREMFKKLLVDFPASSLKSDAIEKMAECDFFLKDYHSAIDEFADAMSLSARDEVMEPALYYQGRAYMALNIRDSALYAYTEYLRKYPSAEHSSKVRVLLSGILSTNKAGAEKALALLREINPTDDLYFDSRLEMARAYQAAGQPDSAESLLLGIAKSSDQKQETARADFQLGKIYYENKAFIQGRDAFLQASKDNSLYAEAMKNAAVCAAAASDYSDAKVYFLDSISRLSGPELLKAHFDYAAALYASGDYSGAAQVYASSESLASNPSDKSQALYMAAESNYRAGQYQLALNGYSDYLGSYPNGDHVVTALLGKGYSEYYSGNFVASSQIFQNFIDTYPSSALIADAYLRLGDSYYYEKDYQKSLNIYREAAAKFSGDSSGAYALFQVGQAQFRLGNLNQAIAAFNNVLRQDANSSVAPAAQYAIGWVYFTEKNYPTAIDNFNRVVVTYPSSTVAARALYSTGDSYYNLGKYQEALSRYRELLVKYPSSDYVDNAIVGMQYCLTVLGRTNEAEGVIDDFVRNHPDLPHVDRIYYKKVEYALNQKKYASAELYLKEFLAKFPNSSMTERAMYDLAQVETKLGKSQSAVAVLADLTKRDTQSDYITAGKIKLAEIYESRGDMPGAIRLLNNAVSSGDEYSTAAEVALGKVYLQQGDTMQAESNFSKAALSQTDSLNDGQKAEAKVLLSKIYFSRGHTQEAISLANSVAKTREDIVGAKAQLQAANFYCGLGDSSDAVLAYLRVKYVFPNFPDIVAQSQIDMANCLAKLGDIGGAKALLEGFIKGRSDDSYTRLARERLRKLSSLREN